jgi:hypothetical protein
LKSFLQSYTPDTYWRFPRSPGKLLYCSIATDRDCISRFLSVLIFHRFLFDANIPAALRNCQAANTARRCAQARRAAGPLSRCRQPPSLRLLTVDINASGSWGSDSRGCTGLLSVEWRIMGNVFQRVRFCDWLP